MGGSFQFDDVAPTGSGILALEVVLNGICEHVGLALAILLSVLLCSNDNGLEP